MIDNIWFSICKKYALIQYIGHQYLNINIIGFGWLLRKLKKNRILNICGVNLPFKAKYSDNYLRLITGIFNEPETHSFIHSILAKNKNKSFTFIEVGANIGEFYVDLCKNKNIEFIYLFEPQPELVEILIETKNINNISNSEIYNLAISSSKKDVLFNFQTKNHMTSGISSNDEGTKIKCESLDNIFHNKQIGNGIILIDVEGHELEVIKGASTLIKRINPIIIFEYHSETKKVFSIDEVYEVVGDSYKIFKLNKVGDLEINFENSWNCVAIPTKKYNV